MRRKRLLSGLLAIAMVSLFLFSAFLFLLEADHACEGEDCPVCLQIASCTERLESFRLASVFAVAAFAVLLLCAVSPLSGEGSARCFSLISMKVKLSD